MSVKQITTGQDSFLDIVANLVGILIILVVVVGAQASANWSKPKPNTDLVDQIETLKIEESKTSDALAKIETDNAQLEDRIIRENRVAARLTDQRHQMLMQLNIVKNEIAKQRKQLESEASAINEQSSRNLRKQTQFLQSKNELERNLASIQAETNAVSVDVPKSEVINHFPNPIAKTVFAEEVHFRLFNGKLSYVPMDELIARMKSEWKVKAEKLKQSSSTVETVGPIDNFRMQYELVAEQVSENTKVGPISRRSVKFSHFQLLPSSASIGEPVDQALQEGSKFLQILSRHEPRKTTVSIWVYPGSFEEHGQLKNWLHENGFQMASWPLDYGKRISGGPNGFKTSSQ